MKVVQITFLWMLITAFGVLSTGSNHISVAKRKGKSIDRVPANQTIEVVIKDQKSQ